MSALPVAFLFFTLRRTLAMASLLAAAALLAVIVLSPRRPAVTSLA
jgi:hypothetical protein